MYCTLLSYPAQKDEVPLATNPQLFNGIVFILTRGYKSIYEVHQEKILLRGSLPGSSTEDQYEESEGRRLDVAGIFLVAFAYHLLNVCKMYSIR